MSEFKRPALPGQPLFEAQSDDADPAEIAAAGHRVAHVLVRGTDPSGDAELVERVLHLADGDNLATVAELWSHAGVDTLAGALWRLYVLRAWVHRNPAQAAHEFDSGRAYAPVREVLAGVVDPPGPDEVVALVDTVVRGIVGEHFDVVLDRAAAFAHIVGVGRASLDAEDARSAAKLVDMAGALRHAADLERRGALG